MVKILLIIFLVTFCTNIGNEIFMSRVPHNNTIVEKKKIYTVGYNVGLRKKNGRFRIFKTVQDGFNALVNDIEKKQSGRSTVLDSTSTIEEFVYIYAPQKENDTEMYLKKVLSFLGVDKDQPINEIDSHSMAKIILKLESGRAYKKLFPEKEE